MTPDDFRKEIETKLIPVLANDCSKKGIHLGYRRTRNDEYVFELAMPIPSPNGAMFMQRRLYTVWYVDDKMEWCEGELPQYPAKDI